MKGQKILACAIAIMMAVSGLAILNVVTGSQGPNPEPMTTARCVLLEDFTEWKCGYCPARAAAIDALLEGTPGYGYDVVAPVFYHVWWPGGDDPMYFYNTADVQTRANYYGVPSYGVPETFYDGKDLGQDTAIKAHVDSCLSTPSNISITSSGHIDAVGLIGSVSAHITALDTITDTNLVAHFAVWEHNTTRYPGGNEAKYLWVMKNMLPSAAGTPIWTSGATTGQSVDITYPFTLKSDWVVPELGISIWVQKVSSKLVYQAHVELCRNTPPTATVLDNNGQAEDGTWTGTKSITWTAVDMEQANATLNMKIEYSPNNGGNWYTIEDGTSNNDGVCPWNTATVADGTNYLIRVTATDGAGATATDVSDAVFTINNTPTIDLTYPNGGELWRGGATYRLWWNVSDLKDPATALTCSLYYSTNGGASFPNTIVTGITGYANPYYYDWTVPTIDSTTLKVKATVVDTDALSASDQSATNFALDSTWPLAATNFRAELTGTQDVTLYWTVSPSSDVAYYQIYQGTNNWDSTGNSYSLLYQTPNNANTSYTHGAAGNNTATEYCYQLRTFDQVGHETRTIVQAAKYSKSIAAATCGWGGWNMVGSSLVQKSYAIDYKLQGLSFGMGVPVGYNWSAVQLYNPLDSADHWKLNLRNGTASLNEITTISNTQAFWICTYNNARYVSAGYISNMSIPLKAGWNLVPYPLAARTQTTATLLANLQANCPSFGGTYNDMEIGTRGATYRTINPVGTESLTHQDALWVRVTADTTWTVINY